jgi:hypothetical protein
MVPKSSVPTDELERVRALVVQWQEIRYGVVRRDPYDLVLHLAELERSGELPDDEPEFDNVVIGFKIPSDPGSVVQPLALLHDAKRGVDIVEASMDDLVLECRRRGYSWADIATALGVTRQSAWTKYASLEMPSNREASDPGFATAVERAYLRELKKRTIAADADLGAVHKEVLASALHAADRTNGGLRFKRLSERAELEARLMRALVKRFDRDA